MTIYREKIETAKDAAREEGHAHVFLGKTQQGYEFFWVKIGVEWEDGFVTLPFEEVDFDGEIFSFAGREFTLDGKEILFKYLVHYDLRKYHPEYLRIVAEKSNISPKEEKSILMCCGGGSTLPGRAAEKAGLKAGKVVLWAANTWLLPSDFDPSQLDDPLRQAAVAITKMYLPLSNERREIIL